jgi:hypothetical protein
MHVCLIAKLVVTICLIIVKFLLLDISSLERVGEGPFCLCRTFEHSRATTVFENQRTIFQNGNEVSFSWSLTKEICCIGISYTRKEQAVRLPSWFPLRLPKVETAFCWSREAFSRHQLPMQKSRSSQQEISAAAEFIDDDQEQESNFIFMQDKNILYTQYFCNPAGTPSPLPPRCPAEGTLYLSLQDHCRGCPISVLFRHLSAE